MKHFFPKTNLQKQRSTTSFSGNSFRANESNPELTGNTIADKCQAFAYMLGLDEPVPERVLESAVENSGYMRRLLLSKDNIPVLYDLLNNPPGNGTTKNSFSNAQLISKAGKALMRWAVSGFPTVSKEKLKTREDACLSCPNLVDPVSNLQRFSAPASAGTTIGTRTGNMSCSSCGCVVQNKILLATESCPEHIAGNIAVSRWGEGMK
ncbi:MAG: hypothetical protein HY064_14445 [Bacteroidetes bacterium]|nr:hypothetical protein [Bacteroidota bacterium]